MAIGLGSTVEELVKELSKKGDVTAAGNNKFTGNNTFAEGVWVYAANDVPPQNTLGKVNKNGFTVYAGIGFYQNEVKFKLDPTATTAKEYYIATDYDLAKKQATLVSGENIKTINGQSILGEGDLEISGGGSGGSGASAYAHVVTFGYYDVNDGDIGGWGSIVIYSTSTAKIIDTSTTALTEFIKKVATGIGDNFYPIAIRTNGYTDQRYSGIFYNTTTSSLKLVGTTINQAISGSIECYDVTETVVQTSSGGSGGGSSSDYGGVIISVASTNSYRTDPQAQLSEHKIRVRIVSGTLQVGDRLEICRPIAKKSYNRVNGVKTKVRWKQKLKAFAYKIITAEDITNIQNGKNILVLTVNHSRDQPNKGFLYTCTKGNDGYGASAPRTIRIVRRTELLNSTQNIQISNSVYVTRNCGSDVIKGM